MTPTQAIDKHLCQSYSPSDDRNCEVVMEDLNVRKKMKNRHLSKEIEMH